ncbi:MAG: 16S rRNA (guanine(527)-N(7))-methyltransferase RsmG [Clostridia bacterium]|nr:16S rRNA (guanine(527)-N(7))-methyltransferase RsmG [Clostridia bacterium]
MEKDLKNLLIEGAKEYEVVLTELQIENFMKYKDLLKEWNEKINLTAIEDDKDVMIKHFVDSLSILPYLENTNKKVMDVGTGAGFPGIPLKIVLSNLDITLFDSLEKRIKYLNIVIEELKLQGIRALHGRAEEYGMKQEYREKYDIVVARAVANLPVLLEYCLPFVKTGGIFIAMKGSNIEEVDASAKALDILGGKLDSVKELTLPFSDMKRNIIIIKKLRQTPTKYPRKAGKPSKEPLI